VDSFWFDQRSPIEMSAIFAPRHWHHFRHFRRKVEKALELRRSNQQPFFPPAFGAH
jgi:hypothetical protein